MVGLGDPQAPQLQTKWWVVGLIGGHRWVMVEVWVGNSRVIGMVGVGSGRQY